VGLAQQIKLKGQIEQARQGWEQCKAAIPPEVGNFVKRAQCGNDAAKRAGVDQYPDLALIMATRMVVAERIDRGVITPAEGQLQIVQAIEELRDHNLARRQAQSAVDAQNAAAWAGVAATGAAMMQGPPRSTVNVYCQGTC
jgi:hypothetical protein